MGDARDKAIAAMVDAYEHIRRSVGGRYNPGDHRIARELLDAIPADVLVDLAIDRGALVESGREELARTEALPDGRIRNHFRPLYRRATEAET